MIHDGPIRHLKEKEWPRSVDRTVPVCIGVRVAVHVLVRTHTHVDKTHNELEIDFL